jgi:hypothetical protein
MKKLPSAGFRGLARIPSQRLLRSVFVSPHPRPRPHKWGQGVRIHLRPVLLTLGQT